jgi:glycosyltransferase involved in cell wall biosynthesis
MEYSWHVPRGPGTLAMKSVLMIAYAYPPILTVGRNRTLRFERHLPSFGYHPIIHTVRNPDRSRVKTAAGRPADGPDIHRSWALNLGRSARVASWIGDKLARLVGADLQHDPLRRLLFFPDVHIGWIPLCLVDSLAIIRRRRVSAIYVTCSPFSAAITGVLLKKMTGLPLVLDFRDPWSFNDHNVDVAWLSRLIGAVERRLVAACDALIANTATAAQRYRELYPQYADRIAQIYNGITAPPWVPATPAPCFTLLYVGTFYNIEYFDLLFETVRERFATREIAIEFAGFESAALDRAIDRHGMRDRVTRHGFVESPEALQRIYRRASALLYYNGFKEDGTPITAVVRAKLYDYLATGVPILAIAPPGEVSDLLARFSPGSITVTGSLGTGELRAAFARGLEDAYRRWERGELTTQPNDEFLRLFGGEELTRQLAAVLDGVTDRAGHRTPARSTGTRRDLGPSGGPGLRARD